MNCLQCGAVGMKTQRENYQYTACGLPGVTLRDIEVSRCYRCGYTEVAIPRIEELHRAIAFAVIRKRPRLMPAEIRFLRKHLGWSGADFAAHMGVTPETVSRWEQGASSMGATAERALRLMVATREPAGSYPLDVLKIVSDKPAALRLGLSIDDRGWHAEAA